MDQDLNSVKTDVELLKKDMNNMGNVLTKLDTAIDKIADVSNGISKILAVHDQSIENMKTDLYEGKRQREKDFENIHKRISDMKDEHQETRQKNHKEIIDALEKLDKKHTNQFDTLSTKIHVLDKWRYWILGIGASIGFIAAQLIWLVPLLEKFITKK